MRLHRFIGRFNLNNDIVEIEDADLINQIKNVFRLKPNDQIALCDGANNEAIAQIIDLDKKRVEAKILERSVNENKPKNTSVLFCALLKKENFEIVVQKAVECGIKEVVPILTERTVKLNINMGRLQKIAREAAEQSGRGVVPNIYEPTDFEDALKNIEKNSVNLFFDISGEKSAITALSKKKDTKIGAWIGPEGGWSESELKLAREKGFEMVTLGKITLRGETAAIVASYLISNI